MVDIAPSRAALPIDRIAIILFRSAATVYGTSSIGQSVFVFSRRQQGSALVRLAAFLSLAENTFQSLETTN